MDNKTRTELEWTIKKDMTNAICVAGANLASMEHAVKKNYVSKREMARLLKTQKEYLRLIQDAKDKLLEQIKNGK